MTKKQKNMLTRILVTAVLYAALVAADHMKRSLLCLKAGSCCFCISSLIL